MNCLFKPWSISGGGVCYRQVLTSTADGEPAVFTLWGDPSPLSPLLVSLTLYSDKGATLVPPVGISAPPDAKEDWKREVAERVKFNDIVPMGRIAPLGGAGILPDFNGKPILFASGIHRDTPVFTVLELDASVNQAAVIAMLLASSPMPGESAFIRIYPEGEGFFAEVGSGKKTVLKKRLRRLLLAKSVVI